MTTERRISRVLPNRGVALGAAGGLLSATLFALSAGASPGVTTWIGEGQHPTISGDGRHVAYNSGGIYVHDRQTGVSTRISGGENPDISDDGRYVAYNSGDIYVHDRQTGVSTRISAGANPAISGDGRFVAFDSGGIFVYDRHTGATTDVSADLQGRSSRPDISDDGRVVVFQSNRYYPPPTYREIPEVYAHDRQTGVTTKVSVDSDGNPGNRESRDPRISGDGRFVAFVSSASDLVPDDPNGTAADVFVHDRQTGVTTIEVVEIFGGWPNDASELGDISDDGRYVAYYSHASNLVEGDTNDTNDVFVRDRQSGTTIRLSVDSAGNQLPGHSNRPTISDAGSVVAFESSPTWHGTTFDIFVHDILAEPPPTPTPMSTPTPTPTPAPGSTPTSGSTPTFGSTPISGSTPTSGWTPTPGWPPASGWTPTPGSTAAATPTSTPTATPTGTPTSTPGSRDGPGGSSPGAGGGAPVWVWLVPSIAGVVLAGGGVGAWAVYRRWPGLGLTALLPTRFRK